MSYMKFTYRLHTSEAGIYTDVLMCVLLSTHAYEIMG